MKAAVIWLGVLIGLAALLGAALFLLGRGPSDRELILRALEESVRAGKEGRAGGVLEYLSESFTINRLDPGSRGDISRFVREARPDVTVLRPEPIVRGDTATITSPVRVKLSARFLEFDRTFDNVIIRFRKETGTRYGILPTRNWKIVSVEAPDVTIFDFLPGGGF